MAIFQGFRETVTVQILKMRIMKDEPQYQLDDCERMLLMAALIRGPQDGDEIRANCMKIIKLALCWAGLWIDGMHQGQTLHPMVEEWYRILIAMIRHQPTSESLLDGKGNLILPANPHYKGCGLQ